MRRSVYIETTIPSAYHDIREDARSIARRESTRRWWEEEAPLYDLQISAFVVGELAQGDYPGKDKIQTMVQGLDVLEVIPEIEDIARVYVARSVMPAGDLGDAYHLAIASYYAVDFILTWNCRHLANANKVQHIKVVNGELGLHVPLITTPDLLLREENDHA